MRQAGRGEELSTDAALPLGASRQTPGGRRRCRSRMQKRKRLGVLIESTVVSSGGWKLSAALDPKPGAIIQWQALFNPEKINSSRRAKRVLDEPE
jgi:hypothetical protein